MAEQLSVSKANAYAVAAPPDGVSTSKAVAYAVLSTEDHLDVSKLVAYAVLEEAAPPAATAPIVLIIAS